MIKAVHACGGFLRHALDLVAHFGEPARALRHALFDLRFDHFFFFRLRDGDDVLARFSARAQKNVKGRIAAIVQDHVGAILKEEGFIKIIPMLFQGLAFDRENRNAGLGNRGGRVILGREDIAAGPTHIGTQSRQCFNQNGGLNGHMQRTDNARAFEGLFGAIFRTQCHQAWHFRFSNVQFFAAIIGKGDIFDDVIVHECRLLEGG